jgi:hypothetical protein
VKTDKEVLAGLGAAHRAALEEVFGNVGRPGAATMRDVTDDKRPAAVQRVANPEGARGQTPLD